MPLVPLVAQVTGLFLNAGLAAAGAAAISIPIAIHLLSQRRRVPVRWAAMQFLIEAYRQQRRRLQFEQYLLLIIRCLILLLLGLALAGPLIAGLMATLTGSNSGRTIYLFLDDSLSTRTSVTGSSGSPEMRFEKLRQTALKILDATKPEDRVALITAGKPSKEPYKIPTLDHAGVRSQLEALEPRYSAADWSSALFNGVLRDVNPSGVDKDRTLVFLISDFSASTIDASVPPPTEFAAVGDRARVLVMHPAQASPNVQISEIVPFRRVVFGHSGTGGTFPVEVKLRRYSTQPGEAVTHLTVSLQGSDSSKPLTTARREVRWSAGQSQASVNLDVSIPNDPTGGTSSEKASFLTLRGSIEGQSGSDSLAADDTRDAGIELRSAMTVALIDEPASAAGRTPEGQTQITPRFWMSLALQPGRPDGPQPIRLTSIEPAVVRAEALRAVDAAVVLRPDLLSDTSLISLRDFAQAGGVVLIVAPPLETPSLWGQQLPEKLGLPWQIGSESLTPATDKGGATTPKPAAGEPGGADDSWSLSTADSAPAALRLLASDWSTLLRPIHVNRRISISSKGSDDQVFLRLADGARSALMISTPLGQGRVLLLATALNPDWTDLMTKPIFVPLLHETLQGLLGNPGAITGTQTLTSGERLKPIGPWKSVGRLLPQVSTQGAKAPPPVAMADALDVPGLYLPDPPEPGLRLLVNTDASGGDTRRLDESALGQWLSTSMGSWAWMEADHPDQALQTTPSLANLGWPILWVVLALLVLEAFLARHFSHASLPGESWFFARVNRLLRGGVA